jgi:hypothetical protein
MSSRPWLALTFAVVCSAVASAQSLNPSWTYSSYFGGNAGDSISAQTSDPSGNIYVAGITSSPNFPTTAGVYEPNYPGPSGDNVVFVAKFSSSGALVWSTFLGPGCYTYIVPEGIAVDANKNVYVSGIFECSGYPTTVNLGTSGSVFLTKLNSTGSKLVYSTTLGGNSVLGGSEVVLDSSANAYVSGAGDICCNNSTGIIGPLGGISDFWIAKINSAGTALPWSVEIGGSDDDEAYGLTIDAANKLYLTGYTASTDFPTTPGALDQPGFARTFVVKLDPTKSPTLSMVYSALAGNPGNTVNQFLEGEAVSVDPSGNAYIAAWTYNTGLYASPSALQRSASTVPDAYVFEINAAGSAIVNGTYLGGGSADYIKGIAVDHSGNTYVSGFTQSWDFPTTAYGNEGAGAYYVKLNPQFAAISSVEFSPNGGAYNATSDLSGGLWVSGDTLAGFPTTPNAYQPNFGGGSDDGFLLHTNFLGLCSTTTVGICTLAPDPNNSERFHITAQSANTEGAKQISLQIDGHVAYKIDAAQFDTWLPIAPGLHSAIVTAYSTNQKPQMTEQSFTVGSSSTCPLNPLIPSLTICDPLNGAFTNKSTTVIVEANDSAPPASIGLYVDGKFVTSLKSQNGIYIDTLTLEPGAHTIAVRGTDSGGDLLHTSTVFQVSQ